MYDMEARVRIDLSKKPCTEEVEKVLDAQEYRMKREYEIKKFMEDRAQALQP